MSMYGLFLLKIALFSDIIVEKVVAKTKEIKPRAIELWYNLIIR